MLAHTLAFRISTRLLDGGELSGAHVELLAAQLVGGLAVTAVAVLPVLIVGGSDGVLVAQWLLLAFVAVVAYVAARSAAVSPARALVYVLVVVALTVGVLWVKSLVH